MNTPHRNRFVVALLSLASSSAMAQQDVSIAMMTQPVSGCALSADALVKLHMFNHGEALPAGTVIELSYRINGGNAVRESLTLTATLLQNTAIAHEFATRTDLSVPGSYAFSASADLKGDINPMNNTLNGHGVMHWAASAGGEIDGTASTASGTLTLHGHVGRVVQWEQSDDDGQSWQTIANATPVLVFEDLEHTTQYRAELRNGACAPVYSSLFTVTPW
jgi:hypothetical protein